MANHTHHKPLSAQERGLWQRVVVGLLTGNPRMPVKRASAKAFESVEEYRKNITWRSRP